MEILIKQIRATKEMIFSLTQNPKETLKKVNKIYEFEQEIDEVRRKLMEELFDLEIDPITLIKARDLLQGLEDISNQTRRLS